MPKSEIGGDQRLPTNEARRRLAATPRRVLLIGGESPTVVSTGMQQRFQATLRGLSRAATIDYVHWSAASWKNPTSWRSPTIRDATITVDCPIENYIPISRRTIPDRLARAYWWWRVLISFAPRRHPPVPFWVARQATPRPRQLRRELPDLTRYDLVWCFALPSALAIESALRSCPRPLVVDFVDYPAFRADGAITDPTQKSVGTDLWKSRFMSAANRVADRRERDEWRFWFTHVADQASCVVFCNPEEAAHMTTGTVAVIPNGCSVPAFRGSRPPKSRPVLLFVGWMNYPANSEAAEFLAREIVPALRRRIGDGFEARIVGAAPPKVLAFQDDANVVVTGFVPRLADELEQADVVVVPLKSGSGTHLKILEAFANQIPVVSTTIGAAGLAVTNGHDILIADDPETFAEAVNKLLADPGLRESVVTAAYHLVAEKYNWSLIERAIADLVARNATTTMSR